jgi:ketosteroid isomerase-like protein
MASREFDSPEAVEAAFYEAFSRVDLDLMVAVWCDGEHALCIHPGSGLLRGKAAVIQSWMEILSGNVPPAIEYRVIESIVAGNLAVRLVEERIRPRNRPPESANRVLATNIYLREAGSWRLTEHHASLPLVARDRGAGSSQLLH